MSLLRGLVVFKLGALLGMAAAAALVKQAVPSRGGEESDEVALVAVFDGIRLRSRARSFKGGSLLAWFGGIDVDLRDAELAADARLSAHALFGGIHVKTPPSWRIESSAKAVVGGIDTRTPAGNDPGAPVIALGGLAVFGGIDVGAGTDAADAS